jgi:hypothetical protein
MRKAVTILGVLAVALLVNTASANFFENFDSYAAGSNMHGQGGWKGWDNSAAAGALVSNAQSFSAPNSVDINGASDLVHEFSGYTAGTWTFSAQQFVPTTFTGQTYFILLNKYRDGGASDYDNWSTQLMFDATGFVQSQSENTQLPLIKGQWVEVKVVIDLTLDNQKIYYGNQLLSNKSWTGGLSGGGVLDIAAVDLFANNASTVYYDNVSITPEPATALLFVLALGLLRRR